jgi:hypothetical protein
MTEPRFFKPENNENAEEFIKCLPLGVQTSFTMMAPAIATAELLRVRPMIGDSLFERAAAYYASHEAEDATLKQLVALLQMTVVRLACWDSFDEIAVMMTDAGISDNQGEKRVYRYQADALKSTLQRQGYEYLNKVLEFCTEKVSELPKFKQSQYYTIRQNSLIHSMADFEKHISIGGDFCVFAKLREWIEQTEAMELEFRIGAGLKTALLKHGTDNKYRPIIRSVEAFVAHWSMSEAAPFLNLIPTAQGLMIVSEESRQGGNVMNGANKEQVATFTQHHREAAERYIGQVVTYCKRHVDTFPEIEEIGMESDTEHGADLIDNHGHKTFLVL